MISTVLDSETLRKLAIRPCPNGRFFERAVSGEAFFPLVDTAWEIFHRLTKEEVIRFLDERREQGFNGILGVLLPELDAKPIDGLAYSGETTGASDQVAESAPTNHHEKSGSKIFYPNRYGHVPLINDEYVFFASKFKFSIFPEQKCSVKQPNEAYFEHIDWVVQQAAERDILTYIVPTWARYVNTGKPREGLHQYFMADGGLEMLAVELTISGWAGGPVIFSEESARIYGKFVGKRYPFCPKVLGGDSNPIWTDGAELRKRSAKLPYESQQYGEPYPSDVTLPKYDLPPVNTVAVHIAMAQGIVEEETSFWDVNSLGRPLITYHPCPEALPGAPPSTASSYFSDQDWLTFDATQSGHSDCPKLHFDPPTRRWDGRASHVPLSLMWNSKPVRPIIDLESHYEEGRNGLQPDGSFTWTADDVRSGAWQSVLSGACGVVYGSNVIWQMYDPERLEAHPHQGSTAAIPTDASWQSSLRLPGPVYLEILKNYFLSLPREIFDSRAPAQELLASDRCPEDSRERDGRVDVMRDVAGPKSLSSWLVAHSGMGYAFELVLSKAFKEGTVLEACWLDPRSGKKEPLGRTVVDSGFTLWEHPEMSGSVVRDWVLELKRV